MFNAIEVLKMDKEFRWMELKVTDTVNNDPEIIRVAIDENHLMMASFIERYMAKRDRSFTPPHSQANLIEEFFQEACMAKVLVSNNDASPDLVELLPTTVINFRYPEKTSFRKSRPVRIQLFLDEGFAAMQQRDFESALQRFNWVHHLDPANVLAFELKIVCLRSWKKMAECIPVFEAWSKAHPDQEAPWMGLGEMWLYLGQYQRARETFNHLLEQIPNHCQAIIGMAQALLKLGEDPLPLLRRARVLNASLTTEMLENDFDFRSRIPQKLESMSLMDISEAYQIPVKRVMERARKGVLPMFEPDEESHLFRFSREDLDRHYHILQSLGMEIAIKEAPPTKESPPQEPVQPEEEIQPEKEKAEMDQNQQAWQPGLFDD